MLWSNLLLSMNLELPLPQEHQLNLFIIKYMVVLE